MGYWSLGKSGRTARRAVVRMGYWGGMIRRAVAREMGRMRRVPLAVPVPALA